MSSVQYAVYSVTVQSVVCKCSIQCTVFLVQCDFALFSFQYSLQFYYVVCNVQCSGKYLMYSVQFVCVVYSVLYALRKVLFEVCSVLCVVCSVHCFVQLNVFTLLWALCSAECFV